MLGSIFLSFAYMTILSQFYSSRPISMLRGDASSVPPLPGMEIGNTQEVLYGNKEGYSVESPTVSNDGQSSDEERSNHDETILTKTANVPSMPHPAVREGGLPACILKSPPEAPQPVILLSLGRSGSSATWQVMGNLTGKVTPSIEYTGSNTKQSIAFFDKIPPNDHGNWLLKYMCVQQSQHPTAGLIGFKWKPVANTFFRRASLDALRMVVAYSHNPQIKVVRSRRNLLDVMISKEKHRIGHAEAHCAKTDNACIREHLELGTGLRLPTETLLAELRRRTAEEDNVDRLLEELGVPHIKVSFEKLYYSDDAEEWLRLFRFLGTGPTEGLTRNDVQDAMAHAATHNPQHNVTLGNYHEVRELLMGTEFESLLR